MSFLFRLIFSCTAVYVAIVMNTFDAVGLIATVLSGDATTDFRTILLALGLSS